MTMQKFAVAALAAAAFATPAAAQEVIRKGEFDLNTRAGVEALNQRIENAARRACATSGKRSLSDWQDERRCVSDAIAQAAAQVPQVAQLRAQNDRQPASTRSLIASN